jgi:hypothetical protein
MTDEAAVWLQSFAFGLITNAIYWFASYEPAGTIALLVFGLDRASPPLPLPAPAPALPGNPGPPGCGDSPESPKTALKDRPSSKATTSAWPPHRRFGPFLLSLGLTVAVTGLAFGLWLLVLGSAILALSVVGWLATINQEIRHGPLRDDRRP